MHLDQFSVIRDGDVLVVACRDELDMATAPRLHAVVAPAEAPPPRVVVLDLRELTFLDTSGFDAVAETVRRFERLGAWCAMTEPARRSARRVLDLCDPRGRLRREPTVDDALRAAASPDAVEVVEVVEVAKLSG
jgi:anti-anti-sigma factor